MTEPGGPDAASGAAAFARWLRQERELRGLERDEVARLTKLGGPIVEALESGDAARMPPKGYVFGYLRTYAGAVGLDADDVVLRWQEVVGAEGEAPPARGAAGRGGPPRALPPLTPRLVAALVALIAVLVLLALALFGGPRRERPPLKLDRPRAVERGPYAPSPGPPPPAPR